MVDGWEVKADEEKMLKEQLGEEYTEYMKTTKRLIGSSPSKPMRKTIAKLRSGVY